MRRISSLLEPIAPAEQDAPALKVMDRALWEESGQPRLISATGEELPLPESVYQVIRAVVHLMASGRAIHLLPVNLELTTQEASELLNVSRPHVVKLLETGKLPFRRVGTHRRVRLEDLLAFKHTRDRARGMALEEIAQMSQEYGIY
jgi:excisionase family DNA binding protein